MIEKRKSVFFLLAILAIILLGVSIASSFYSLKNMNDSNDWSETWEFTYSNSTISIFLYESWNLIGWYQDYNTTASSLADNITGCTSVSRWNASLQTYDTYIVGGPPSFDFDISKGMGLFVDVTEESFWYGN